RSARALSDRLERRLAFTEERSKERLVARPPAVQIFDEHSRGLEHDELALAHRVRRLNLELVGLAVSFSDVARSPGQARTHLPYGARRRLGHEVRFALLGREACEELGHTHRQTARKDRAPNLAEAAHTNPLRERPRLPTPGAAPLTTLDDVR